MDSGFASWIGRSVVLRLAVGDSVILWWVCEETLLKDGTEKLKIGVAEGFDIDVYKDMVLAVAEEQTSDFSFAVLAELS